MSLASLASLLKLDKLAKLAKIAKRYHPSSFLIAQTQSVMLASIAAQPRYLRPLREVVPPAPVAALQLAPQSDLRSQRGKITVAITVRPSMLQLVAEIEKRCERQRQDLARRHIRRIHAFTMVWPLIERRLQGRPNLNASELFDELRGQYPGRFHLGQLAALIRRVNLWREDARARGTVIGKRSNRTSGLPRTWRTRADPFEAHWPELCEWLATDPDQTGLELFAKLRSNIQTATRRTNCGHCSAGSSAGETTR